MGLVSKTGENREKLTRVFRSSKRPVNRWPRHRKHIGQVADAVIAGVIHAAQFPLLFVRQLWLFAL